MKTSNRTCFSLCIICILSLLAGLGAANCSAQTLKWKLKKDQQFDVVLTQQAISTTRYSEREVVTQRSMELAMKWKVLDVADDGLATLSQKIESIKLSEGNPAIPNQVISIDTTSDTKPERVSKKFLKQIQPLIGTKFIVEMAANGAVNSVSLSEQNKPDDNPLAKAFPESEGLDPETMGQQIAAVSMVFPDKELEVGEKWERKSKLLQFARGSERVQTFELNEINAANDSQIAMVSFESGLEPNADAAEKPQIKLTQYQESGTLQFDLEGGYLISSKANSTLKTERQYQDLPMRLNVEQQQSLTITPHK